MTKQQGGGHRVAKRQEGGHILANSREVAIEWPNSAIGWPNSSFVVCARTSLHVAGDHRGPKKGAKRKQGIESRVAIGQGK